MKQLNFDFINNDYYNISNFIINDSNVEAYNFITTNKEQQVIFLNGEEKCGKTYLSIIWKQLYNAKNMDFNNLNNLSINEYINYINSHIESFDYYIIDELDFNFNEEKLFYIINFIITHNSHLLIISNFDIFKKRIYLKDLSSRIKSSVNLKIKKFCKKTKNIWISKLLSDKGIFIKDVKKISKQLPNNYKDILNKINSFINFK